MTDQALIEIRSLKEVVAALVAQLSPYIGQDEMQARYGVTGQTLLAMERKGKIPQRKNGRWLRNEVIEWESR